MPAKGHLFWHSSYAFFVWWLNYRIRTGDPPMNFGNDRELS
jgi:hypothetical protein